MTISNGSVKKHSIPSVSSEVTDDDNVSNVEVKNSDEDDSLHTSWKSIYLLTAICFFCGVQFSIFFPTLWPFLNTVDPTASETFFGLITAAFSFGQGIASPAFGYWMNRSKSIRQPLVFGIIIMIISNVIFCFVESFAEKDRRWVMMIARFCIGIGAGTVGVQRAYAATASSLKDRARAITFVQASYVIGMTIGPGIQVAFTPIKYPGLVAGRFHLDMYTAPAWFACVINILCLLFIFVFLEESYAGITEASGDEDSFFAMPNYDKISVGVCVVTQFTLMFIITNLETVGSMYAKMMWAWTNEKAVTNIGILQATNGLFSVIIYGLFAYSLGDYVSKNKERLFTIIGLFLGALFHIVTFPFPWFGGNLPEYRNVTLKNNHTETVGCDRTKYPWCATTHDVNFWVYAVFYGVVLAACFPIVNISMNTLFSKILGSRRQGTMQGVMLMAGSLARTLGPLLVSYLFQKKGPIPLWYTELAALFITMLLWIVFYRRIVPLESNPKLKPYEYYEYDKGVKYRI
ncbi:unnamed protein product [Auanema sp. JU1783]|nr:unnamed protein product [Auanema sp. JU1783]